MKLPRRAHLQSSVVSSLACLAAIEACGHPLSATAPLPTFPIAPALTAAPERSWDMPRFFEIGSAVSLSPAADPVDTTGWVNALLREGVGAPKGASLGFGRSGDSAWDVFVYSDVPRPEATLQRFALVLPKPRPTSSNGAAIGVWNEAATAFDFGVGQSTTFGNLGDRDTRGLATAARLKARVEVSGINVQDIEQVYDVEGTRLGVLEHKGLVPGLPASFDRYTIFDRDLALEDREPTPVVGEASPVQVVVGLRPAHDETWKSLETFDTDDYRVVLVADASGALYFLAAPLALRPTAYFGGLSTDMVIESGAPSAGSLSHDESAAALFLSGSGAADLVSGKVADRRDVVRYIARSADFLAELDRATRDLKDGVNGRKAFLRSFVHQFLASHRKTDDPRLMMRWAFADTSHSDDAKPAAASVWFGRDQANILYGLIGYYRKTADRDALDAILGLAEATTEAMTPSGSVWMKTFEGMQLATEVDRKTRRADAFIDNGAVAINFNHRHLVIRRGEERVAGATWGAFSATIDGRDEYVESGAYQFSIDGDSLPPTMSTDRDALPVSRSFTRADGRLRVREVASLTRGVPAAKVQETIEWAGDTPVTVNEVRLGLGDFFEYGDGVNETSQNRYGFGRAIEGVPLHVGFWMEGLPEPLWGDGFEDGQIDLNALYQKCHSRFLIVFGYDKAQIYYLPQAPDAVVLLNTTDRSRDGVASKDGYRGWASLEIRYRPNIRLAPGTRYAAPEVFTYTLWAPLFSADRDTVPDELQSLGPLWTDLVQAVKGDESEAARLEHLRALPDPSGSRHLDKLLHTSMESDHAYAAMQAAWMATSDLLRDLLQSSTALKDRAEIEGRERVTRRAALRGAEFSLMAMTHLRNRFDLMPAYGIMRSYAFHVAVFDWAYRETCDSRYRDAMLYLCNQIASSDRTGGLQVTEPTRPNFGAYLINEQSRTSGENDLDDQGMKLWALRIAYDRTGDARYRRSAELFVDHWIKVRASDHTFLGTSKVFDRYEVTGVEQRATPLGHYALMRGLAAWADIHPRARELYEAGLKNATERHTIHTVGTTGVYEMGLTADGPADFGTSAELAGMFLWALTSGRPDGPLGGACRATPGAIGARVSNPAGGR